MTKKILAHSEADGNVRSIIAYVDPDTGDLVIDGQDVGPIVERMWGDSDYEYWLRIPHTHKTPLCQTLSDQPAPPAKPGELDEMLLGLLETRFRGDGAFTAIREWCEAHAIPAQFSSYS